MPGREGGGGSSYMQKWNQTGDLYNRTYSHAVPLVHASDRRSKRGRGKRRPVTRRACWLKVFSDCWCTGRRESLPPIPSKGDCRQVVIVPIHPTVLALTRALQSQGCIQQKQVKKEAFFAITNNKTCWNKCPILVWQTVILQWGLCSNFVSCCSPVPSN